MKKILLFLISLMGSTALFGQESITLTFTGQDENQDYVRLNNVVITNLTRGWSDQIVFPDTIYTLNIGVGVEEYAADNEMKVMPNPFDGVTRINLSSAQTEKARLMVVDMQGRLYAQYAGTLTAGDNYFNITLSTPQMYILMVQTPTRRQSLKMVNTGHGGSNHITFSGNLPKAHRLETKGASTRTFFPGDEMRYVGRGQHLTADQPRESAIITQPQNTDETIVLNFVFADGIPCPGMPTVTDHEGNVYNTVQIGSHCWTKENMRCVTSPTTGTYLITPDGTSYTCTGKQAHWVNGDSATYAPQGYGVLYNWNAAVDTFNTAYGELSVDGTREHPVFAYFSWLENRRGICPEGWHIPSLNEWPGNVSTAFASSIGWNSCSEEGTPGYNPDSNNTTGFSALPAGFYFDNYNNFGTEAIFWTATRFELDDPIALYIAYNLSYINLWPDPDNCFSVRCVRDYEPNSAPWTVEPEKGTPCPGTPTVTDHEGNVYNTVQIGSQCWTKENMRCRTSPTTGTDFVNNAITYNGNADPHYQIANSYTGKTAHWLNGDSIGHSNLGLLYNWNAAVDTFNTAYGELHLSDNSADAVDVTFTSFRRGICPEGWHIPSVGEWNMLLNYVNSQDEFICQQGGLNYGNSSTLKAYMGWNQSLGMSCPDLRNATGFTALPIHLMGTGNYERYCSRVWSSYSEGSNSSWLQVDESNYYGSVSNYGQKNSDQSVRCVKDQPMMSVTTAEVTDITDTSVVCGGVAFCDGGAQIEDKGVCWNTNSNPTINDDHSEEGAGAGVFTSRLTGLSPNTTYYVRAYAISSTDTVYGDEVTWLPIALTSYVTNVTTTTAECVGFVHANGSSSVTARGTFWSTTPDITMSDSHTNDGSGTGSFTSSITGLSPNTTYYVRTYATNSNGTAFGGMLSFTTHALPSVSTSNIAGVSSTSATCGGNVNSDGGVNVTARGVCWSTSPAPTVNGSHTTNGTGTGSFTSSITGLTPNTTYYVRSYATNSYGTAYGEEESFTTPAPFYCGTDRVTDIENNTYNTLIIGQQCWMKENLRTTRYADNTPIEQGGSTASTSTAYWYYPDNNSSNKTTYGLLYNWKAVMYDSPSSTSNPSNVQGICPNGWHVPSDAEWTQLTDYIGSQNQYVCGNDNTYIAKSLASPTGWCSSTTNNCAVNNTPSDNNSTGFCAPPAGYSYGSYFNFSCNSQFWSSTGYLASYLRTLSYDSASVVRSGNDPAFGFSVRCIKDWFD